MPVHQLRLLSAHANESGLGPGLHGTQGTSWTSVPGWQRGDGKVRTETQRLLQREKQKDEEKMVLHKEARGRE